jgi:two-component system phosphate regulon sensor histidine kinase PhoR
MEIRCRNGSREEKTLTLYSPRLVHVQVNGAPLPGNAGAVMVIADISRLVQLETVRKDFVANVSHELKTPIQSIKGFAETLLADTDPDPADQKRFLGIILRNTLRMEAIIADLLTLARLEHQENNPAISFEAVHVEQIIHEVINDLSSRNPQHRATIKMSGPADLQVKSSGGLIEQAIANLLDNALRYAPLESPVEVHWEKQDKNVVIHVLDHGPGIPLKDQDRIFERFYRVEKSRNREAGGTGLGLAIVRHVAQLHGGKVRLSSTPGQGADFILELPALD